MDEIFESAVRSNGGYAGVFECDDEVGYFYLYDLNERTGSKVVGAVQVTTGEPNFDPTNVAIMWDEEERHVGLFINGTLWAVFDAKYKKGYGGQFSDNVKPDIDDAFIRRFYKH